MLAEIEAAAEDLGTDLMPWQRVAARYMTALAPRPRNRLPAGYVDPWKYRRFACIVGRQNGKTELIKPRILLGFKMGRRMLHTAQDRYRPRETFEEMAAFFEDSAAMRTKYGVEKIREANGQEFIACSNGAKYTLVSPRSGRARGGSVDDVFLDEVREYKDNRIEGVIRPTITARPNGQVLYFSNAGDEDSIVLNTLRRQADEIETLCYLEWSAAPERALDDREGWAEANPALGTTISEATLLDFYRTLDHATFETEHLCRWVITSMPSFVAETAFLRCEATSLEEPVRPMLGICMDPSGKRASAYSAWQQSDGTIALRAEGEFTGDPIDPSLLGPVVKQLGVRLGAPKVGYAPWTDAELAKHLKNAKAIDGRDFAAACQTFVQMVHAGRIKWVRQPDSELLTDLKWTARKAHDAGAFHAVRANEEHPITAVLAAIRAVGLASGPVPSAPRVY
jgi:hypothetical protein